MLKACQSIGNVCKHWKISFLKKVLQWAEHVFPTSLFPLYFPIPLQTPRVDQHPPLSRRLCSQKWLPSPSLQMHLESNMQSGIQHWFLSQLSSDTFQHICCYRCPRGGGGMQTLFPCLGFLSKSHPYSICSYCRSYLFLLSSQPQISLLKWGKEFILLVWREKITLAFLFLLYLWDVIHLYSISCCCCLYSLIHSCWHSMCFIAINICDCRAFKRGTGAFLIRPVTSRWLQHESRYQLLQGLHAVLVGLLE